MGKSSLTKLQLKHIPDFVVLETILMLQYKWRVRITSALEEKGPDLFLTGNKLSLERNQVARFDEIAEALSPIPAKLVWAKLQKLEAQRKIESFGPRSIHFKVRE